MDEWIWMRWVYRLRVKILDLIELSEHDCVPTYICNLCDLHYGLYVMFDVYGFLHTRALYRFVTQEINQEDK